MNYEKEYVDYYNRIYTIIENRIKNYYLMKISEKQPFGMTHEEVRDYFKESIKHKFFLYTNKELRLIQGKFNNRNTYYTEDIINLMCKNRLVLEFTSLNKSQYPTNYHFKKLLIQIALINAIEEIERLLQNYTSLFEMHYNFKDYNEFEIKQYDSLLENSTGFLNLLEKHRFDEYRQIYSKKYDTVETDPLNINKAPSLPLAIALLREIGFFELDSIKNFSPNYLAKVIAVIQIKDPDNPSTLRTIAGNIRVLDENSLENNQKYTSHKNVTFATELFDKIKKGNKREYS